MKRRVNMGSRTDSKSPVFQSRETLEQGVALLNGGDPEAALKMFRRLIDLNPESGLAHYNAGVASQTLKNHQHAIVCYQRAIDLMHEFNPAYHNIAQAYANLDRTDSAIKAYHQALRIDPEDFKSAFNLSLLYRLMGDDGAAIDACRHAIRSNPDFAEAFSTLGLMYMDLGRFDEAQVALEQALRINPVLPVAFLNLGVLLQKCGRYEQGVEAYRKALTCDPVYAPARWLSLLSLPMVYDDPEQIKQCRHRFSENLDRLIRSTRLATDFQKTYALKGIRTTTNFYLQYQAGNDLDLQTEYGHFVHRIMAANYPQWVTPRPMPPLGSGEKIRIGYLSCFMCQHTVGTFLSGWIENHDKAVFEVRCYHVGQKIDGMTDHFRHISDAFHHFPGDVEAAAHRIAGDRLHILVYSDIGMDPTTLQLAALRLAPVQCKGWGHPVTTGLPTVDYYLSSDLMEPSHAEQHYSETLVRLPNLALCHGKPELPKEPKTRKELGIPSDRFVYLSTQSIFKYLPQHDDIYPRIALRAPHACFVFIRNQSLAATDRFRNRLRMAFENRGLDADQYCHFSPTLNFQDFLSLNLAADALLDTLEWSGGKTTMEALSCGLPVVTSPGRFMRGRHAYAMLRRIGVPETIAVDKADYCRIAIRLALDPGFHKSVKNRILREASKLYNDHYFIEQLEVFYRSTVEQYRSNELERESSPLSAQDSAETANRRQLIKGM